jgi:hypothetical protein
MCSNSPVLIFLWKFFCNVLNVYPVLWLDLQTLISWDNFILEMSEYNRYCKKQLEYYRLGFGYEEGFSWDLSFVKLNLNDNLILPV